MQLRDCHLKGYNFAFNFILHPYSTVEYRTSSSSGLLCKNLKITKVQFDVLFYRTVRHFVILPVVLYENDTWFLTLREEQRLKVFENMVLWRMFRPKVDKVTRCWRELHNEALHTLYSSRSIFRMISQGG